MRVLILFTLLLSFCASDPIHVDNSIIDSASRLPSSDIDCAKIVTSLTNKSKTTDLDESKNNHKVISHDEEETIKTYIFQGPILNFYLRNRKYPENDVMAKSMFEANNLDEKKIQKIILDLDNLIKKYSNNKLSKIYYRGESRPNDGSVYVGARLPYENYISTTQNKELAIGYANGNADDSMLTIVYEINIEPGQLGLQINEIAPVGIRNQDEFLLARDGALIVDEINNIDGITYIKASYSN